MNPWIIVLIVLGGLIVLYWLFFYVTAEIFYWISFVKRDENNKMDSVSNKAMGNIDMKTVEADTAIIRKEMEATPHEEWNLIDDQGQKLYGYAFQQNDSKEWFVISHGYKGEAFNDVPMVFPFIFKEKRNFLAIDHQACGKSEGNRFLFGLQEYKALILWMKRLVKEKGEDITIYLLGDSMGCGTALYTANKDVPPQLKCIIADCGYVSPIAVFGYLLETYIHLPKWPLLPLVVMLVKIRDHVDMAEKTTDCVKEAKVPILYFCGDDDRFVPLPNTKKIYEATSSMKGILIVPGAPHAMSYRTNPELYKQKLDNFLDKVKETSK